MWGLKYFTRSTLLFSMFSEHVAVSRSNRPRKKHDVDYSSATVFGRFFWDWVRLNILTPQENSEILKHCRNRSFFQAIDKLFQNHPQKICAELGCCRVMFDGWPGPMGGLLMLETCPESFSVSTMVSPRVSPRFVGKKSGRSAWSRI